MTVISQSVKGVPVAAWLLLPQVVSACSVCFGDPQSPMTQGAVAGVTVLCGVVGFVLLSIAGTTAYFCYRGALLSRDSDLEPHSRRSSQPPKTDGRG